MIAFSDSFYRDEAKVDKVSATICLADGTYVYITEANVWENGLRRETGTSVSGKFTVGGAVTGKVTLVLDNTEDRFSDYDFRGAYVRDFKIGSYGYTSAEIGVYYVEDYSYNGTTIQLTMLDGMSLFDKTYDPTNVSWPATLQTIVQQACIDCGVGYTSLGNFPNYGFTVEKAPSSDTITYHDIISYCAQIAGCYARVSNTYGTGLIFDWYDETYTKAPADLDGGVFDETTEASYQSGDSADGGTFSPWSEGDEYDPGKPLGKTSGHGIVHIFSLDSVSTDDVIITGVKVSAEKTSEEGNTETVSYTAGEEGYVISIEENPLISSNQVWEVANYIGSRLIGMRFRPLTITALEDPAVEAGDVAMIGYDDTTYYCFLSTVSYTLGGSLSITCDAEAPAQNFAVRYSEIEKTRALIKQSEARQKTARELAVEDLTQKLASHSGLYSTIESTSSGSIYYLHDAPKLAESQIVWKMTTEAWGVSTDGGKTWNGGMTVNGDTITRILTATGVNADWINTGTLTAGLIKAGTLQDQKGKNSWNLETGEFKSSGTITNYVYNSNLGCYIFTRINNGAVEIGTASDTSGKNEKSIGKLTINKIWNNGTGLIAFGISSSNPIFISSASKVGIVGGSELQDSDSVYESAAYTEINDAGIHGSIHDRDGATANVSMGSYTLDFVDGILQQSYGIEGNISPGITGTYTFGNGSITVENGIITDAESDDGGSEIIQT